MKKVILLMICNLTEADIQGMNCITQASDLAPIPAGVYKTAED